MKKAILFFSLLLCHAIISAQPVVDTAGKLVEQKTNVITTNTILKVENLGPDINTGQPELRPTISADGDLLFFICENDPLNTHYRTIRNSQDIWFAERDSTGKWGEARHLGKPFNSAYYNAVYWISPDKNKVLLRGAFVEGDYFGNGLSFSQRMRNGKWSKPNMLFIKNYEKYDKGAQSGATLSNDGKTLLMYMAAGKNRYNNDLYFSKLLPDGTWTEPKTLGKHLSTDQYNELTPYLAADGETLYFSSDRPGGLGDNDIWMTRRLDKSWQKWSEPVNLGAPINTPGWDAFFTLDAGGEYAYLTSSDGSYGESDIVRVKLLEIERPKPVLLVSGNVYNKKTGEPVSASLLYEILPDGTEAGNGMSNPDDGAFQIVLPYDKNYLIRATADHFFAQSENLNLDSLVKAGYREIHKDLYLVPIEVGQVVRLNNVFFDFDKWDLRPESYLELDRVVQLLKDNPAIEIEMSAHTDSKGSDDYNFKLSDNRARSVMEYILSKGIDSKRITSQGYGESQPVATNETDDGRQLNRRVEFKITRN